MAKKKTLEEKLAEALNEAEGGLLAGAKSEDLGGTESGKKAATKESKASYPTASQGEKTTGKLAGADASEIDGEKPTGGKEKAGLPDAKGAGNSEAGYTEFTAPEKLKLREQIEALLGEELSLSEEFKDKAVGLFEAAVIARSNVAIMEHKEKLQSQFDAELLDAVETVSEQVDSYVTYAVNQWTKDNQVALEKGMRTELAESFIAGMHTLFSEHYISVPEGKEDLVESLQYKLETMEEKYNSNVKEAILKENEINELKKTIALKSLVEGLAESEIDKLTQLTEGIEFDSEFEQKVNMIKESYFNKSTPKTKILAEDKKIVGTDPMINESTGNSTLKNAIFSLNSFKNKR